MGRGGGGEGRPRNPNRTLGAHGGAMGASGGPMVPPREAREIPLGTQENACRQNRCGGARGPIDQNNDNATEDEISDERAGGACELDGAPLLHV